MTDFDPLDDFFDDRWEQSAHHHFFFLGTREYREFSSSSKHWVVKGHRGTGKTTLFRALHWGERLSNPQLIQELGGEAFSDRILGCFMQLKFSPVALFDEWLQNTAPTTAHEVIAAYMRASWIQDAVTAAARLNTRFRFAGLREEVTAFSHVAEQFWRWFPAAELQTPTTNHAPVLTLADLERCVSLLLDALVQRATIAVSTPAMVASALSLFTFNRLVNALFEGIEAYLRHFGNHDAPWSIRICLDEGEFLSPSWSKSVRMLIRECDAPLLLAISVLEDLGAETLAEGTEISSDDRRVLDLDRRSHGEFLALVEGVLQARVFERSFDLAPVKLSDFLGSLDVNDLFTLTARQSEHNTRATRRFLSIAARWNEDHDQIGPVEQYLIDEGALSAPPSINTRAYRSTGYRKKKVAGYLTLIRHLGFREARYAGWRVALHCADNSVRDFFRFLRALYAVWAKRQRSNSSVAAFLQAGPIDALLQDQALQTVGVLKLASLPDRIADKSPASSLIAFLGEMSHLLDSSPLSLASPNPTWFTFSLTRFDEFSSDDSSSSAILSIVKQCVRYGYLSDVTVLGAEQVVRGRVNTSLARRFGFSYWEPQYETRIPHELLTRAIRAESSAGARGLANQYMAHLEGEKRSIVHSTFTLELDIPDQQDNG